MNKIDEWTKLDKLDKIGLLNWLGLDKNDNSIEHYGQSGGFGQKWTKLAKLDSTDKIGQNYQIGQ